MIHTPGDCIEVMAAMPADSVDSIVTDPPYGLEFMGKEWDSPAKWDKRGLGPERGFKGKARAPVSGFSAYQAGSPFQAWCEAWGREALRVTKPGGYLLAFGGTRTHHRLVCGLEDAGWIIRDELDWIYASGFPKGKANLKPAHEPIVLARKPGPLQPLAIDECRIGTDGGTRAVNFGENRGDKYGGGAGKPTNDIEDIAAGRWPSNVLLSEPALFDEKNAEVVGSGATDAGGGYGVRGASTHIYGGGDGFTEATGETVGYGDSGGYSRFFIIPKADRADREPVVRGQLEAKPWQGQMAANDPDYIRSDGVKRTQNIPRENAHPTVKPVDLMRHLVRLVTPSGGTVLDPFLGSGSTAIAAELEGFPWIGIEKEPEYVAIAEARLNHTQRGFGL